MITKLLLKTKAFFLLAFLMVSTFVFAQQTLIEYNFNTQATWNTANTVYGTTPPLNPVLKFYDKNGVETTPTVVNGQIQLNAIMEGAYLELSFDATSSANLNVSFNGSISNTLFGNGTWNVQQISPVPSTSLGDYNFNILNPRSVNVDLNPNASNNPNVKIRITAADITQYLLQTELHLDNLKITSGNPNITVYKDNLTIIPDNSDASEIYNTVFSNLQTVTGTETKTYRVRNYRGSNGSVLNVSSIQIEPAAGTTPNDFTVTATSNNITNLTRVNQHYDNPFGTFDIRFTPQAEGVRSAVVRVYSNGAPSPYSFTVIGGGRSCAIDNTSYVINTVDIGTQTLVSDLTSADFVGGTSNNPTPQILGTSTLTPNPNPRNNLYTSSPSSWYTTTSTAKTRNFGGTGVDISQLRNVAVEFNVAAFGKNNASGVTNSDYIQLSVWINGSWQNVMRLVGSNNSNIRNYSFTGGSNYTGTYGSGIDNVSNDWNTSYKRFKLNIPLSVSSLQTSFQFRITAKANADAAWLIDDVRITSDNAAYKTWNGAWQTWNGTAWVASSKPTTEQKAVFAQSYDFTATGQGVDLSICGCEVKTGATLTIPNLRTLTVQGAVINHGDGTNFIVKDGGSLIQKENGAINTGEITVENTFKFSAGRAQYNYVISPVVGQNLRTIYPGNPTALYHAESTNYFYNSSGAYIAGRGLALKEPAGTTVATQTATYKGVPFNGILDYGITYSAPKPNYTPGWNLIGNPYPSNLDLIEFYNKGGNNTKISATFKFWDNRNNAITSQQGSGYVGPSYATYNVTSGSAGTGTAAMAGKTPNQYVKPGVAFMAQAKPTANGQTIHFDNAYRAIGTATDFHGKQNAVVDDRFWLSLTSPTGVQVTNAVVYFPNGNNEYAVDDSDYSNLSDDIYTILGEHKLIIQGKAPFVDTDVLPLGIKAFKDGNYTIALQNAEGVFDQGAQEIYLKDKQLNIITDLSAGAYTFATTAGEHTGRFEIVYKPSQTLGTQNTLKSGLEIYRDGQDFVLRNTELITQVEVFDLSGRLAQTVKANAKELRLPATSWINGVYILKVQTPSGNTTKRVIK